MRIAILSDTHGNMRRAGRVVELLGQAQPPVQIIVHCGDVGSPQVLQDLAALGKPIYAVGGNMDRGIDLETSARELGVSFCRTTVEVPIEDGQHLVATHGHIGGLLEELIAGGQFPYVCCGHTHQFRDDRIGPVRVINPGAVHRSPEPGIAILDTKADELTRLGL
jgi:putative phosphoesterase